MSDPMQPSPVRAAIAALGRDLTPDVLPDVAELFQQAQQQNARRYPATFVDLPYGSGPRQKLDIYAPMGVTGNAVPVLVFVHGGGFLKGDKGSANSWMNANVGIMAARAGLLGVVINYRLAPDNQWPAGGEDVGAVVDWLKTNAASHGGDPDRIVLMGTSAGAVHCATYLRLRSEKREVRGLVLLSGLYGITPLDDRDTLYYGDQSQYPARWPLEVVTDTELPLLIACAEFDPPRFQSEFVGLLQQRLDRKGHIPRACIISGHNHYSLTMHLGTSDTRLADEILAFVRDCSH